MLKRIGIVVVCALVVLMALAMPVLAIDQPDTDPDVDAVLVYEDLLEDGDIGILINYYIDYTIAGTPTEPVSDAYLAVFIDTDGITQLKAVSPYTFVDNGYYRGLVWIYFSADEVDTFSIESVDEALYSVWLTGNPTVASGWTGDPPKTIAGISQWYTTGDSAVLLAQQVLAYADMLELAWSPLDMIEATALGNRLTATGAAYFTNVITNLRTMAPACFATGTVTPTLEDIDYDVSFGAVVTSGTTIVDDSPLTLDTGANTITVNGVGVFTVELEEGTYGTIADGTATITDSPSNLVPGVNIITVDGGALPGTLIITVALSSIQQTATEEVEGTGFDVGIVIPGGAVETVPEMFGMSTIMFSGLLWAMVTVLICGAAYAGIKKAGGMDTRGAGSIVMLFAVISLIGGALMGLVDMRVVAMLAIGYGAFIGYMLFFRTSADIGRTVMFMGWMWFIVCLVGGLLTGIVPQTTTVLTADITDTDDVINVSSTEGFKDAGIITIGDERIVYSDTTDFTFTDTFWRDMIRGAQDTEAVAHLEGAAVRTTESALINDTLNYNIALLSDASGIMSFVTLPLVLWNILLSFIFLPLNFLGTDMVILTYIWAIIGLGLIVSFVIALIGGRRV